jgi:hypothetical protein
MWSLAKVSTKPEGMQFFRFVRGDQSVPTERNRNQLRSRHWKDPVWIGNDRDTLVNPNQLRSYSITGRTHKPSTDRLKATTSFTFIVLWHHCQDTHLTLTRQERANVHYRQTGIHRTFGSKASRIVEEEIPGQSVR